MPARSDKNIPKIIFKLTILLIALFVLAFLLAWVASDFNGVGDWLSYLGFLFLGTGILFGGWKLLSIQEPLPNWLLRLLIGAALLRLLMGAVWVTTLPRFGYGNPSEQLGYVMSDAHKRDTAAWDLSQSDQSLFSAYGKFRKSDQYGGFLFMSASLYRLLGGETHPPLGMVAITAAFSALVVPLAWAFSRRAWNNPQVAGLAAWALAIYPEAVLQGSSQMREAFLITLTMAAFYGLARYRQKHSWVGPVWILGALLFSTFLSPPSAGLILGALVITGLVWGGFFSSQIRNKPVFWVGLGILAILILVGSWIALERLAPRTFNNPIELVGWWFNKSAQWQAYLTERASGWIQRIFDNTPNWLHTPLLLSYGVLQPFLPAALADTSATLLWRLIAIWRSLGWAILIPFLVYAPLRAVNRAHRDRLAIGLSLVVWLGILITAFRAGADPWDNVRYRSTFAGLQILLISWAWVGQRASGDPWLRRALILVISILAWFLPWYMLRYIHIPWPVSDPFKTLGLGLATAALIILWDWVRQNANKK